MGCSLIGAVVEYGLIFLSF